MPRLPALFALLIAALLQAPSARALDAAATPSPAATPAPAAPRYLMWEVTSKAGRAFLFGSIHVADKSVYPLSSTVDEALAQANSVAVEADISKNGEQAQKAALSRSMYKDGRRLSTSVSKSTYALTKKRLEELGLDIRALDQFKPWAVAMTITLLAAQRAGLNPQHGLDLHFIERAWMKGLPIVELESVEEQLELFDSFPPKQQERFLQLSLEDAEDLGKELGDLLANWKAGDEKALERLVTQSVRENPELKPVFDALIGKRNVEMANKVDAMVREGRTPFVVVGAAHLVGRDGVVELLRKKGYKVERR